MNNFFLVFTKEQIDRRYEMIRNDPEESFLVKHYPKFEWVKGEPEMANETIEDIVRDVRHVSELHGMSYKEDKNWHLTIHNYTRILADSIEAAQAAYATRRENEDSIVDLASAIIETRIQKEEKNGCEGK